MSSNNAYAEAIPILAPAPMMMEESGMGGDINPVMVFEQEPLMKKNSNNSEQQITKTDTPINIRKNQKETMFFKPNLILLTTIIH